MREIIFKAKRIDNGEWVEGYLLRDGCTGQYFIHVSGNSVNESDKVNEEGCLRFVAFEVDESTICQYTGLCDKKGQKIWENDIVKHYNVPWEPAQFTKGVVYWNGENLRYERSSEYTPEKPATVNSSCVYEVIGNVFDNPELLKEGAI